MSIDLTNVQGDIVRISDRYHTAVTQAWLIGDDAERDRHLAAVHAEVAAELGRLRARFEVAVQRERDRLRHFAFTPSAGSTADRTEFDRIAADIDATVVNEVDAFRALADAADRQDPLREIAVLRIAYRKDWIGVLRQHRSRTEDHRSWPTALARLLDFDDAVTASGLDRPEAFDLARRIVSTAALN